MFFILVYDKKKLSDVESSLCTTYKVLSSPESDNTVAAHGTMCMRI